MAHLPVPSLGIQTGAILNHRRSRNSSGHLHSVWFPRQTRSTILPNIFPNSSADGGLSETATKMHSLTSFLPQSFSRNQDSIADFNKSAEELGFDSKKRIYECSYVDCQKIYTKSSHLKAHLRSHTGKISIILLIIFYANHPSCVGQTDDKQITNNK